MEISKGARTEETVAVTAEDLRIINEFTKRKLSAEDVFTFSVLLCDNEVDRDFESFTVEALYQLEKLFLGKTGIFDHQWSTVGQKARIYRTQVLTDKEHRVVYGKPYTYLKAHAYMLCTENNKELIEEIEGGIKREVSIGCSVAVSKCSICGENAGSAKCSHTKGVEYGGELSLPGYLP